MKDSLFLDPGRRAGEFAFDESVTAVFDDMIKRSVPFYFEIQNMIVDLVKSHYQEDGVIYDLGCSTGATATLLSKSGCEKPLHYVGVDNSEPMLDKAQQNIKNLNIASYELRSADLNKPIAIDNASVVILNLVLQFVKPENREQLISDIYSGLMSGGCLLLVEKVVVNSKELNDQYVDFHHQFKKRNLYTDIEIARKRESLENILQPFSIDDNRALLKQCGFAQIETFFQWFNFCGLVAIKK